MLSIIGILITVISGTLVQLLLLNQTFTAAFTVRNYMFSAYKLMASVT